MGKITNITKGNDKQFKINQKVDLTLMPNIKCLNCNGDKFISVITMKYVSKIQSPTGQEGAISLTQQICRYCDKIFDFKEWKNSREKIIKGKKDGD